MLDLAGQSVSSTKVFLPATCSTHQLCPLMRQSAGGSSCSGAGIMHQHVLGGEQFAGVLKMLSLDSRGCVLSTTPAHACVAEGIRAPCRTLCIRQRSADHHTPHKMQRNLCTDAPAALHSTEAQRAPNRQAGQQTITQRTVRQAVHAAACAFCSSTTASQTSNTCRRRACRTSPDMGQHSAPGPSGTSSSSHMSDRQQINAGSDAAARRLYHTRSMARTWLAAAQENLH